MIFPLLEGVARFTKAPLTWAIFILNVLVFIMFAKSQDENQDRLMSIINNDTFIVAQGNVFAQLILDKNEDKVPDFFVGLANDGLSGNKDKLSLLGQFSLRSKFFMNNALNKEYMGDEIENNYWKKSFEKIQLIQKSDISYMLGYANGKKIDRTISYQFIHGGFLHLFGNMIFLLIFGSFLERRFGSPLFLLSYLVAGVFSAFAFSFLSGDTAVPLVGASGAISGLMGWFIVEHWKKPVQCIYWLLPIRGYYGLVMAPVWVVAAVWLLSDMAGYFGTLKEIGGIAHAAHLGGLFFGMGMGAVFLKWPNKKTQNLFEINKAA